MKSNILKKNMKKNKKDTRPKKQIPKFKYGLGKIILVILFTCIVALAIYFILDWSLDLASKRNIINEKSIKSLITAVKNNDYDIIIMVVIFTL